MKTFRQVAGDAFNDNPAWDGVLLKFRGSILIDPTNFYTDVKGPSGDFFHQGHWIGDNCDILLCLVRTWDSEHLIK